MKPLSRERAESIGPKGIVWRRQDYEDYVTKAMKKAEFIRRELQLSEEEFERAENLLESGIVREVLLEDTRQEGRCFYIEKDSRRVVIAGPAEPVAVLRTMIIDELTFLLATRGESSKKRLAIVSLVDPTFLEEDPQRAIQIAEHNYEGVKRILKPGTRDYRRSGKRIQFNPDVGTVSVLDHPGMIQKVGEYLALQPYAPRAKTY